ncbi:HAD family hydrolase [Paenibacillus hodogayensis]|uniref:HAD family hydrolase n=1 Tax=Paenibacillus hodogayensis TaxID=279208 RepID=A0ABV5VQI3_9BACL
MKAIFLDFYGTLVHEDDAIIPLICEQIKAGSGCDCDVKDIGTFWWKAFSTKVRDSFGDSFKSQRAIGMGSLEETIRHFRSEAIAEEIIQPQFDHWMRPSIYDDTFAFLKAFEGVPLYILSNIDTADLESAICHHNLSVTDWITSEEAKSYKPRPDMFLEALGRYHLLPDDVIHIGDSFTNDVRGASPLGIKTVWLNRLDKRQPEAGSADYVCKDLSSAKQVLWDEFQW